MPLVEGLVDGCRRLPVNRPEVLPQGFLVLLDRGHPIVRPALLGPRASRLPLGMQGIQGDDPTPQVQFLQQGLHGRDLVGAVRDFGRSQSDAGTVLESRDQDEWAPVMLPRPGWSGRPAPSEPAVQFPLPRCPANPAVPDAHPECARRPAPATARRSRHMTNRTTVEAPE